jgi:hypothetical protein
VDPVREIRTNNRLAVAAVVLGVLASGFGMTPLLAWPCFAAACVAMAIGVTVRDRARALVGREGHVLGSWGVVLGLVGLGMSAIGLLSG